MAQHPCHGMTQAETKAFEAIAINLKPRCSRKTLARLLARGVIMKKDNRVAFRDGLPPSNVEEYYVPLPIHMQWCEWAGQRHRGLR
jgi:hypothetical protein